MNAYAVFVVNAHLQELLDEAAANRFAKVEKPSLRSRIASAASTVKGAIHGPSDYGNSILPSMQD
jgi:hypothetical protein